MSRDKEILEKHALNSPLANEHNKEDVIEGINDKELDFVLAAQKETAIEFAEWCESNYDKVMGNEWGHKYYVEGEMNKIFTTSELYEIWNKSNNQ